MIFKMYLFITLSLITSPLMCASLQQRIDSAQKKIKIVKKHIVSGSTSINSYNYNDCDDPCWPSQECAGKGSCD